MSQLDKDAVLFQGRGCLRLLHAGVVVASVTVEVNDADETWGAMANV